MNVNIARNLPHTTPSPQYFQSTMVGRWIQKLLVLVLSPVSDSYSHDMSGNVWAKKCFAKILREHALGSTMDA